jgi:protein-tyrosine phosphatase
MGNICRSPLAACVLRHKARERGVGDAFEIDSAGIGDWHVGHPPDPRARAIGALHDVVVDGAARQVRRSDFDRFDHIMCADADIVDDLLRAGAPREKVRLLLSSDPHAPCADVPDPYDGDEESFALVYDLVAPACDGLLDELLAARAGRA